MQWSCNPHVTKGVREKGRGNLKKRVKSGSRVMQGNRGPIEIVEDRKLKCLDDIQSPPINRKYN